MKQKLKKAVDEMAQQENLKDIDKRLIRGLYQKKLRDDNLKERALNNIQRLFGKHLNNAPSIQERPDEENVWHGKNALRIHSPTVKSDFISTNLAKQKTKTTDRSLMNGRAHNSMFLDSQSQFENIENMGTLKQNEDVISNSIFGL